MTRTAPLVLCCLALAACRTNPKQLVLDLDTTDKAWASAECVAARKAVADYNDREGLRAATSVVGLVAGVPVAGALASAALNAAQQDEREDLNNKVRAACISDPLAKKK
ncbi:MAG TPA: hypothetical protein VF138_10035 [Caulobacteraceae bacterium]